MIIIDVTKIKTSEELQNTLKEKLNFPEFYGMNWDAFWDTITGLIELPENIKIIGWEYMSKNLPNDAEIMKQLLNEYNCYCPHNKCNIYYF